MDRANDQAVSSRLLVRWQKMHGSQKCCGELAETILWFTARSATNLWNCNL